MPKYENKRGKKFIYAFLDEIISFHEDRLGSLFSINDLNNNISPREALERRINIISSIEGTLALKIKLLNPTVLFGDFFDETTKNFYINNN